MNTNGFYFRRGTRLKGLVFSLALSCFLFGCKKDEVSSPEPAGPDITAGFYKLNRVENVPGVLDESTTTVVPPIYYSLETKALVPAEYARTSMWDISFGGLYNSFLGGNNGANSANLGGGAGGKGGILILQKSFEQVVDVPNDADFKTSSNLIGTDNAGDYGEGIGWYLYDFGGTKVRDGAYLNAHIAYSLYQGLTLKDGSAVLPRTLVVRTANGNYAKIKMLSCYRDLYDPAQWLRNSPHMYFTFEYVVVPAGSKKFEIK